MKQYCRYCSYASLQDDELYYCSKKDKIYLGSTARATNKCQDFSFCPLDLFDPEKEYKPNKNKRRRRLPDGYEQVSMFDDKEQNNEKRI